MSKKKATTVNVLMAVDASGSMYDLAQDVRGGFNQYLDDLTAEASAPAVGEPDTRYRITAYLFNTTAWMLCDDTKVEAAPRLDRHNYSPSGGTALLDAIGQLVTAAKARDTEGRRHLVVVNTDGYENSSLEWKLEGVRNLIESTDKSRWGFVFLGADPTAWTQGDRMGFSSAMTVNTSGGTRGTYSGLSAGTRAYSQGASAQAVTKMSMEASAQADEEDTDGK